MHAVAAAERRGRLEQRGSRAAEAVEQEDIGTATHGQRRDAMPADGDVVDLQKRRTAADEPEHAFEGDRVVEVAADVQDTPLKGLDPRELAARVGAATCSASVDSVTSGGRRDPPLRTRAARLVHRTSQVWPRSHELDVVGGVEAGVAAEVAVRQRAERLLDVGESLRWVRASQPRLATLSTRPAGHAGWR